ncbi:unnamed protein product [Rotaria sp. Silwood1]|nr:unnamed protein product [Rotaria sp. Silwood1]
MGLSMINAIEEFDEDNNEQVDMRVDVDSGSVNCGIVGTRKCKFHSFSNNVTLANKMELSGKSVITMSDKRIPFHLRDINNPPPHLNEQQQQQQTWIGTAKKTKKNHQLRQQYPPFVVPTSMYEVIYVHKYIPIQTMQILINHLQNCNEYTFDSVWQIKDSRKMSGLVFRRMKQTRN